MTTSEFILAVVVAIFGSNGLFALIQWYASRKSVLKQTLGAVSYSILSDRLEARLDSGYATPEQRKEMEILIEAYKANGWNGDMDARINRFYNLPTKKIKE